MPSLTFRINTLCFLAFTGWLTTQTMPHLVEPKSPGSAIVGLFCTPIFALAGIAQAFATYGRSAVAAKSVAVLSLGTGGLFTLAVLRGVMDARAGDGGRWLAEAVLIAAYLIFNGASNLRWATDLRKPPPAGLCPVCGYDLRATPDRCPECGTVPVVSS